MEKQLKVFSFVLLLLILGVFVFGFVQTKDLKKKVDANEKALTEKNATVDSLNQEILNQNKTISTIVNTMRRMQEAENQRQAQAAMLEQQKAAEEASKKEKEMELAKQKAEAAEKQKKAQQTSAPVKPKAPASKTVAKPKPGQKKPPAPKKK